MGTEETKQPVAGWYDDPEGSAGRRRYWDGTQWTNRYDDPEGGSHAHTIDRRFKSLYTVARVFGVLAWIIAILGTLVVVIAAIAAWTEDNSVSTVFGEVQDNDQTANGFAILIGGGIGVFVYALGFFALSALIRLMLRVEDNSHRAALATERILAATTQQRPGPS